MGNRTYSPEFKLQVVLKSVRPDGTDQERTRSRVARAYDIHPVTLSNWKKKLKENRNKAFGGGDKLKEKNDKIAKLERMVGKKEVEIALLNTFWERKAIREISDLQDRHDHDRDSPPRGSERR